MNRINTDNMRSARMVLWCAGLFLFASTLTAGGVRIELNAPDYTGERVLLYRYMDLFTLRTELMGQATIDAQGNAVLDGGVTGTVKGTIRIGAVNADLWMRPGTYHVEFPLPAPGTPRSLNGTTEVALRFNELDPLDINALLADLNARLDDFVAQDLGSDRAKGMQAVDIENRTLHVDSSTHRPGTLFINPVHRAARVDSFERKLRGYYNEVKDPWFWQDLDHGIAGLRFGPHENDRALFDRYLKDQPVRYDVPEYVRFVSSFFEEHLMRHPFRTDEAALTAAVNEGRAEDLMALMARHAFLQDPRLCELVMLMELYAHYHGKVFERSGTMRILKSVAETSRFEEHRPIARNMIWDLTAMRNGGSLPPLVLRDLNGEQVRVDTALHDASCLVITASWCTYCEQEMVALEALYKEYGTYVNFIAISLDRSPADLRAYVDAHPGRSWPWYFGGDDPTMMDLLRIRTVPAFFLLNGNTLAQSPAPPPSNGMAAIFHRIKVQAEEQNKLRPDQGPPPRH